MTCLINGMISSSKLGIPVGDIDKNDGFEFGTWDFPDYLRVFEKALGKKKREGLFESNSDKERKDGFWISHRFTEEERAKIHSFLTEHRKVERKPQYDKDTGERKEDIVFVTMPTKTSCFNEKWDLKPEWYDRLIELFSKPDDLPLWVQA